MKPCVLVVDDDMDIRETFVEILEDHGCLVQSAENGEEALKWLRSAAELPCLILLDLMMPVMDGRAFRAEQENDPRLAHIPVVLVSAFRNLEDFASNLRAAAVLRKPPRIAELVNTVESYCGDQACRPS
jgi:CheY-like chemotaxis protein